MKPNQGGRGAFLCALTSAIALVAVAAAMAVRNSEVFSILLYAILAAPLAAGVYGLIGWLVGRFVTAKSRSGTAITCVLIGLSAPIIVGQLFINGDRMELSRLRRKYQNEAMTTHRLLVSKGFPDPVGFAPYMPSATSTPEYPGVWYKSALPVQDLVAAISKEAGDSWSKLNFGKTMYLAKKFEEGKVGLIVVSEALPVDPSQATYDLIDARLLGMKLARTFCGELMGAANKTAAGQVALEEAFQMLTPAYRQELKGPEGLRIFVPKGSSSSGGGTTNESFTETEGHVDCDLGTGISLAMERDGALWLIKRITLK